MQVRYLIALSCTFCHKDFNFGLKNVKVTKFVTRSTMDETLDTHSNDMIKLYKMGHEKIIFLMFISGSNCWKYVIEVCEFNNLDCLTWRWNEGVIMGSFAFGAYIQDESLVRHLHLWACSICMGEPRWSECIMRVYFCVYQHGLVCLVRC